jgi:hypothetical protein
MYSANQFIKLLTERELMHALFVERYVKLVLKLNMPLGHRELNCSPGWHITVFKAEVYAIKTSIIENTNIHILSDSETAPKALVSFQISRELVWGYLKSLMILTEHSTVLLLRVPSLQSSYVEP